MISTQTLTVSIEAFYDGMFSRMYWTACFIAFIFTSLFSIITLLCAAILIGYGLSRRSFAAKRRFRAVSSALRRTYGDKSPPASI